MLYVSGRYHAEFVDCFSKLGFTYDLYTRTDQPAHHTVVRELFLKLLHNGYLYKKLRSNVIASRISVFCPTAMLRGPVPIAGSRHGVINAITARPCSIRLTRRYLQEGLQDRAATRDLDWGVDVPLESFSGKKVYVWIEQKPWIELTVNPAACCHTLCNCVQIIANLLNPFIPFSCEAH